MAARVRRPSSSAEARSIRDDSVRCGPDPQTVTPSDTESRHGVADYFAQAHRHRSDDVGIGVPPATTGLSNATPLAGSTYAGVYPFSTAATDLTYDFAAYSPDHLYVPSSQRHCTPADVGSYAHRRFHQRCSRF